jgi:hypothetical protein
MSKQGRFTPKGVATVVCILFSLWSHGGFYADRIVAHYYVPPFATVEDIDSDRMVAITGYEEIANTAHVQPQPRIFYDRPLVAGRSESNHESVSRTAA